MSARNLVLTTVVAVLALAGCATGTRVAHFGPLPNNEPLVTLIVTEDHDVVRRGCQNPLPSVEPLGCQMSRPIALPDDRWIRAITIVRYTDALPSEMAFEVDAHELCHAVAAVQGIDDPCHHGNGGVIESAASLPRDGLRWP